MKALVIAEIDKHSLKPSTFSCLTAAKMLASHVDLMVFAPTDHPVLSYDVKGWSQVIWVNGILSDHHLTAEAIAETIVSQSGDYGCIIFPASTFG